MKRNFWIILTSILTMIACQNNPSTKTVHYHWIGDEYEEIIMTQRGNVFRGEYIDPGFQERASVPVAGIIDKEGNVRGVGFDIQDGSLYAQINGKITGNTFEADWIPLPQAISEFRSMNMKRQKMTPETEREIAKHPDAFYNWLFPELELCTSSSVALNRVTPFLPEETAVAGGRLYGYQIGEWELKRLRIAPATKAGEIDFHLQIESNGQFWIEVNMQGTVRLSGNTFRYRQQDYEFEVAVYNGFATIKTISGSIDLSAQEDVSEGANMVDEGVGFTADGVYPLLSKGLVDKRFYEINFYCDKETLGSAGGNHANMNEESITKDILSLPEMQFPNAAIMIVDEPTANQPYYTVKAGSDLDDHFATSFWFRVYTAPEYEIRIYDIVSDSEMTLVAWRESKPVYDEVFSVVYDELPERGTHIERAFCKDGKWGLVEPGDQIIIPAEYDDIGVFKGDYDANNDFTGDGLAAVKHDGKWGFINRKNELVVPFKYDSAEQDTWGVTYVGEVAFVERDGERFWIDKNGKENLHNEP